MNVALGVVLALSAAFVWALTSVLSKVLMDTVSPLSLTALQLFIGAIFYLPVVLYLGVPAFSPREWILLIASGIWGYTLADWLFLAGMNVLGVSRAVIIVMFQPVLTMFLAHLLLGRPITPGLVAGAVSITLAVTLVVSDDASNGKIRWKGVLLVVLAGLLWTLAVITTDWLVESASAFSVSGLRITFGALAALPFIKPVLRDVRKLRPSGWTMVFSATILGTVLGQYIFTLALKFAGSSIAPPVTESSPIMASIMAVVFLKERFTGRLAMALILTATGILLIGLYA